MVWEPCRQVHATAAVRRASTWQWMRCARSCARRAARKWPTADRSSSAPSWQPDLMVLGLWGALVQANQHLAANVDMLREKLREARRTAPANGAPAPHAEPAADAKRNAHLAAQLEAAQREARQVAQREATLAERLAAAEREAGRAADLAAQLAEAQLAAQRAQELAETQRGAAQGAQPVAEAAEARGGGQREAELAARLAAAEAGLAQAAGRLEREAGERARAEGAWREREAALASQTAQLQVRRGVMRKAQTRASTGFAASGDAASKETNDTLSGHPSRVLGSYVCWLAACASTRTHVYRSKAILCTLQTAVLCGRNIVRASLRRLRYRSSARAWLQSAAAAALQTLNPRSMWPHQIL